MCSSDLRWYSWVIELISDSRGLSRVQCWASFVVIGISIIACFVAFTNPTMDCRLTYNDLRSNPYLHFDAGIVPRASGDQLDELYHLLCIFTDFLVMFLFMFSFAFIVDRLSYWYYCYLLWSLVGVPWPPPMLKIINMNFKKSIRSN